MNFFLCRCYVVFVLLLLVIPIPSFAEDLFVLPELTIISQRYWDDGLGEPLAEWSGEDLRLGMPATVDEILSTEPSFSLFRRQASLAANPTAAGVSLRNTGATAASRTLVLRDGIPQNDPFGGWVYWARYDPLTLASLRIQSAAQSAVWGNQSPAGVIQMNSQSHFEDRGTIRVSGGSQATLSGSILHQATNEDNTLSLAFSSFALHTDGYFPLQASQRGSIDGRRETDLAGADFKVAWLAAPGLTLEPSVSWYSEERSNGTPLTGNSTDALDVALRFSSVHLDTSWQGVLWQQRRAFQSAFSSVNEDRTAETLALEQFDVPAIGTGGSLTALWKTYKDWTIQAGVDAKHVSGETNEDAGVFRRREAGGEQFTAGLFATVVSSKPDRMRIGLSGRLDSWRFYGGRRIETSLSGGNILRLDAIEDRESIEPSGSLDVTYRLNDFLLANLSIGSSYRLPTLNELHRPFRVRNDIVEANADLDPERFYSFAVGFSCSISDAMTLKADFYKHWISDVIANVPVTDPGQIAEIFGSLPVGGTGSQRQNVELAQVHGFEFDLEWKAKESLTLELRGLWSRTEFTDSPGQALLEGKAFAQSPGLRLVASSNWAMTEQFSAFVGWEYGDSQYDDTLSSRELESYTSTRIGASWNIENMMLHLRVENLFDESIQDGRSSNDLISVAAPRSVVLSFEYSF